MSDQPIALGGGPIALGSTNTTLGSTNSPSVVDHKPKENGDSKMNEGKLSLILKPHFLYRKTQANF